MSAHIHNDLLTLLPRLRGYALSLTRNVTDADDLTQAAALKILRSVAQFQSGTNFSAWAHTIVKNTHLSDCRRSERRYTDSLDAMVESATVNIALVSSPPQEAGVLRGQILRAHAKLPPHLRETLMLVGTGDLSHQEVAALTSCTVGTVKSRLWRARAHMKMLLEEKWERAA